jgi:hypothetical protein
MTVSARLAWTIEGSRPVVRAPSARKATAADYEKIAPPGSRMSVEMLDG